MLMDSSRWLHTIEWIRVNNRYSVKFWIFRLPEINMHGYGSSSTVTEEDRILAQNSTKARNDMQMTLLLAEAFMVESFMVN